MRIGATFLSLVFVFLLFISDVNAATNKEALARQAVFGGLNASQAAVAELRKMKKDGLDALFETYANELKQFSETGEATENWLRIANAIDSVAMQKDGYASRLYWFTDFDQAVKEAQKSNKPILSLRLLGNLNEEFSCANSRFFRAVLYPNAEISKYLRENYILHWKSVRPAPKVTIDFGDGRKIERTLTGNSIHYLLDEDGKIIDALPGLYSPQGFLKYITQARQVSRVIDGLPEAQKEISLLRYRRLSFNQIVEKRNKSVALGKVKLTEPKDGSSAIEAAPRAIAKMMTEMTILRNLYDNFSRYESQMNLDDWKKLAQIYAGGTRLDAQSIGFIRRQNARTGLSEQEFSALFRNLENFIALDTARNDFLFHPKLYQWLNNWANSDLEAFNSRVYAEIFKTPDSDKWLGLYSTDVYTALDGNGIIK